MYVMLPLQKRREQVHLESLRDAKRSDPLVPRLLPLLLTHPLALALDVPHTPVRLITMHLLLVIVIKW